MAKDENGYIVVETVGTFIPFVLLIISILSLVNIVTLQTRIHYALTQAANTLSMYSYSLKVVGADSISKTVAGESEKVRAEANAFKEDVNAVLNELQSLSPDRDKIVSSGEAAADRANDWTESIADDPDAAVKLMMNYAVGEVTNMAFSEAVQALVGRYLANGDMSGDEYLKSVNVIKGLKGLDFYGGFNLFDLDDTGGNSSVLLDERGDVKLIVRYEIEYKFGALPLPFKPKLKVTQIAKTKAWLSGRGKGYW